MGIAVAARGTQIKLGDGADPEVFTTIPEAQDISGPGLTTNVEEVSAHDGNGFAQKVATLKDAGDISFTMNYNAHVTQDALYDEWLNGTKSNYQLVIPTTTPTTLDFEGYVTSFEWGLPVNGVITADVTITINDSVTMS